MTKEETKQTVKEAAIEARMASAETLTTYGTHTSLDDFEYLSHDEIAEAAFVKGTEWQAKQSPWISVKERLPEELESVLVGTNYEGRYYYEVAFVMNGKWVCHNSKPIYWMPIPSFDDILEANRDVLERIKEKGD